MFHKLDYQFRFYNPQLTVIVSLRLYFKSCLEKCIASPELYNGNSPASVSVTTVHIREKYLYTTNIEFSP